MGQMEQFLSGLATIRRKGAESRWWKHPAFSLETPAHTTGSDVIFYIAFPRAYATVLRAQLHGAFPDAHIDPVPQDYNIFNPEGATAIAIAQRTASQLLPIKTYKTIGSDPLETLTSAFSKLKEYGEGAAIQILVRVPADDPNKRFRNAIYGLKEGKSRKDVFGERGMMEKTGKILSGPKKDDPAKQKQIDEAGVKMLEDKGSKLNLECHMRNVSSAKTSE